MKMIRGETALPRIIYFIQNVEINIIRNTCSRKNYLL